MKAFVENPSLAPFLEQKWSPEEGYVDAGKPIANGERLQHFIYRAWYSSCLVKSIPLKGSAAAAFGLGEEIAAWFRWYLDRYADFVKRSPSFEKTGLSETIPYEQKITIEKQFPALG